MGRLCIWQVRRVSVLTATGQQRWDQAYQLVLQWTALPFHGERFARPGWALTPT